MASDAKRRHSDTAVDRISSLPRNLIDHILQCLPVCDAARTSILSRTWRDMWGTHPQLVFNDEFFAYMVSIYDKNAQLSDVSKTITSILLDRSCPILKFHLSIPRDLPLHQCRDMYLWIKNISKNGVRELELSNNTLIAYNMPSYLFSCLELTNLSLMRCVLNPPLRFGGFSNLISVKLKDVTITADMSLGAQLQELHLDGCIGIEHLGCQFKRNNNLTKLLIIRSGEIDWQWFECTHKVKIFMFISKDENNEGIINFDKLVGNMPDICHLIIDTHIMQLLEPGGPTVKKLQTSMANLNSLHLARIELCNLHQIQCVLCLIQSSPNLRYLFIIVEPGKNNLDCLEVAAVEQYLLLPDVSRILVGQLETIKIEEMKGSKAELQFVKLLLASTPLLRWMKLGHTLNDPKEELRISQELLQLPRASTAARVMWSYHNLWKPGTKV